MPAGAVIDVSWILCALLFLFGYGARRTRGRRPWATVAIHPCVLRLRLIPSVLRSLAAICNRAKKRFVGQRLHQGSRIWRADSFSLLRCRFWHRCAA